MSSARYAPSASVPQQHAYRPSAPASNAPPGTFAPGTKVQVGNHRVTIERYLSEGGFAHVYVVRIPKGNEGLPDVGVLKRVAVPDKDSLANMRTEVETMKKLKGHRHIVTYIDSHASQLKGGGYEVFLLMEHCTGGGLIDFMNTRLQHRLTEPEILHIFSDVAEGVATMHYLRPPLLHRDLKVENVLITTVGTNRIYKLCDFGSTAPPRPAAKTAAEGRLIEDDVQRHTTLQYRSPEMIDVYRKQPIDEKSDIWALGVLLYKLCYYTTPFEEVGQMAILNASFKFPAYPQFSDRIKKLISSMLQESPQRRPNIYQVVVEIYSNRTQSEDRRNQQLPSPEPQVTSPSIIGIQKVAPVKQVQAIPEVERMRRGRPTGPSHASPMAKPSPSPGRGATADPFAALDSDKVEVRIAAADELAAKYPSLDEFSLLHDRGQKFEFSPSPAGADPPLNKRVTEALADEAFSLPPAKAAPSAPAPKSSSTAPSSKPRPASTHKPQRFDGHQDSPRTSNPTIYEPTPQRVTMVSTGVQTSPAPSPAPSQSQSKFPDVNKRPVWRVPDTSNHSRTMSQPRTFEKAQPSPSSLRPDHTLPIRPSLEASRSKSHTSALALPRSPASSRPSLETHRPSALDLGVSLDRAKSAQSNRPNSIHVASNLDFLREREAAPGRSFDAPSLARGGQSPAVLESDSDDEKNITSNIDYLRARENEDSHQKKHRRSSSQNTKSGKRSSLHSLTSGTKNIVKGRFGDAFKMFESNSASGPDRGRSDSGPRTPTDLPIDPRPNALTPIAGSEATGGLSDDERAIDETEDLPPEVRRELERRRLSQEERRVEAAAAEYRKRLAEEGKGKAGPTRASTIQNRVRNLLDESQKPVPTSRTAEGYGKYTDTGKPLPQRPQDQSGARQPPAVARKPIVVSQQAQQNAPSDLAYTKPRQPPHIVHPPTSASAPPAANRVPTGGPRPPPPSKPTKLRTGGTGDFSTSSRLSPTKSSVRDKPLPPAGGRNAAPADDEWDMDSFSKRYPSLNKLEMVETEIPRRRDVRDV
ncbi:Ark- serine/threonine protein kinase [Paraconiothyrium brasiliense]|uniref:non-specific serine/threonine protein kinase n=1 Tax=Paraconiothyrium brasiliense TaxID=300254 RepID=A0ABR3R907_9PLEO